MAQTFVTSVIGDYTGVIKFSKEFQEGEVVFIDGIKYIVFERGYVLDLEPDYNPKNISQVNYLYVLYFPNKKNKRLGLVK